MPLVATRTAGEPNAATLPEKLMAASLVLGSLLLRPSLLGQNYASFGLLVLIASCIYFSFFVRYEWSTIARNAVFATVVALFWSFVGFHSYFQEGTDVGPLFSLVLICGAVAVVAVAFANRNVKYWYFKFFILFIFAQCVSFMLSVIAIQLVPMSAIQLGKLSIEGYPESGTILLPFTSIYRSSVFGVFEIPRLQGWFREPGIAQAFITWAIFSSRYYRLDRFWIKAALFIGLLGTLSATALPVFGAVLLLDRLLAAKGQRWGCRVLRAMSLLLLLGVISYSAVVIPKFGILARLQSASFEDRMHPSLSGMQALARHPLGYGHANGYSDELGLRVAKNREVNMFALAGALGIPGLVALMFVYWVAWYGSRGREAMVVLSSPFLFTWLLTQPLLASPLLYVFLLQDASERSFAKPRSEANAEVTT